MITNRSNLIDESNNKLDNKIMNYNTSSLLLVSSENEIDIKKRNKLDEYYHLEEKQARLLKLLANNVLVKLNEENKKQTICEQDEINKVFFVVVELEKLASLVHEPVANLVKKRVEFEWNEKSYFGDILISNYQFYKVYKAVLARYPTSQITLSNLLKRKNFPNCLKKLLDAEADSLENVNRLDMLLDRLVDFPRRILQLLESYLKLLDTNSDEYLNIKKVKDLFTDIFELSNDALEKMNNFQSCYELHYMFDPPLPASLNIIDQNRHLIKQGSLNKVAKRSGELLIRHLALFSDMLLVAKPDRIKRKLIYNYHIESKDLKLIENSNPSNELMFRLIGSDQNNEFKTDKLKDKEDWIKAFKKVKDIQIIERSNEEFSIDKEKIGIIPPIWIKDNEKTTCSNCNDAFTTFKRRHHCRTCGKLYCNTCCNQFIPVQFTQFKDKVRTCRDCYNFLEKSFEKYKSSNDIDSKQINTNDTITNISKTLNGLYEIINDKFNSTFSTDNESDNLNESYRLAYNKQSRKAVKRTSLKKNNQINQSSISNSTNDDEEDSDTEDSDSFENEDIEIIKEDINLIDFTEHVKPLPAIPKIETKTELQSKVLNLNTNSKLSVRHSQKREIIRSDYGYLSKLAIEKNIEIDSEKADKNSIKWERTCFVLYSDYTIGICASQNDLNNPSLVIQLGLFNLNQVNETTFSLIKEELINMDKCLASDSIEKKTVGKLNKKLSLFECNYELKFKNKEIKNEWFELITNQKKNIKN